MNHFDRHHRSYHYDYTRSAWDTRTFIGLDDHDDDRYSRVTLTRRPAASVIGFGDLEFWPRTTTRHSTRDRGRDRDGDRERDHDRPARRRQHHGHRATLKPSLSSGPTLTTTTTDRERDFSNLKQRLSLAHSPPSRASPFQAVNGNGGGGGYPRARSLSLSRFSAAAGPGSDYSDSSPDDDSDPDLETRRDRDRDLARLQAWGSGVPPLAPGSPPLGSETYYRHPRLSLSSPRVNSTWPLSRDGSLDRERERGRYERGYQVSVPLPVPAPPPPTCVSVETARHGVRGEDELRARLGGLELRERFASLRVSAGHHPGAAAGHVRRRSESYERFERVGSGRKGVSPGAGVRANSNYRGVKPQYNQVHALILTWSFHDLRTEDYTAPPAADYVSLEEETARLRDTLEGYGYTVHEFLIPMHRSVESLKAKMKQFCRYAADDTLLIVYYHGHGALDDDNELVFSSHDHPENPEWAKAAAAELYAALMGGDTCSTHGRRDKYKELLKKYERYRPVSTIKWDTLRGPILSAPCDVLLVLDCCAAGGANLRHVNWQPPPGTEMYTKHLFAACGFESSTSDDMTAAMCEVLDEWVPPTVTGPGLGRSASADAVAGVGGCVGGVVGGGAAGGPVGGGQFLTTKRLHQLMEDKLQKRSVGSQPIFKQLLPQDPEQYITLPNFRRRDGADELKMGERRGRRGYVVT